MHTADGESTGEILAVKARAFLRNFQLAIVFFCQWQTFFSFLLIFLKYPLAGKTHFFMTSCQLIMKHFVLILKEDEVLLLILIIIVYSYRERPLLCFIYIGVCQLSILFILSKPNMVL